MPESEPLTAAELSHALPILLAPPGSGRTATQEAVRGLEEYLCEPHMQWEGWRRGASERPDALFLALVLPGATAIVLVPTPGELGIDADEQRQVTAGAMAQLARRKLYFAQALAWPGVAAQRELLEGTGFRLLAPLVYLERDARYPWVDPPAVAESAWLTFSRQSYDEFASTLVRTYVDSPDCPELAQLRPVSAVIAGHQATGCFDPALWEILRIDGRNAGCILLSPLRDGHTVEVVYMGVAPDFRRRGVGELLLRRALAQCRARGARRLTLAVDERNAPARRLYARCGLRTLTRRDAYLYTWPEIARAARG